MHLGVICTAPSTILKGEMRPGVLDSNRSSDLNIFLFEEDCTVIHTSLVEGILVS